MEQLRRTGLIGHWWHRELYPPEPVARVEARAGQVWIGTRAPYEVGGGQPTERLYRLDIASNGQNFVLVAEGRSRTDALPGEWLSALLARGDPALHLPPPVPPDVQEERLFEPFRKWRTDRLRYAGQGWFWKEGGAEQGIAATELERLGRELFNAKEIKLGMPQRIGNQILVPTLVTRNGQSCLRTVALKAGKATVAGPPLDPRFCPADGMLDVSGVIRGARQWIVPGRKNSAIEPYSWRVWLIDDGAKPFLAAEERLLASFKGLEPEKDQDRDRAVLQRTSLLPLPNGMTLVRSAEDSVWLIGQDRAQIAFHPAPESLQITVLSESLVLFWIENAKKIYLVDFAKS